MSVSSLIFVEVDAEMTAKKSADQEVASEEKISEKEAKKKSFKIGSTVSDREIDTQSEKENEAKEKGGSLVEAEETSKEEGSPEKDVALLLEQKEEELLQKQDQLLRTQAEFENYKKRMAREKADLVKFGNEALMKELISTIDDLERSLDHAHRSNQKNALVDGIELVEKDLLKKLEKFGLKQIATQGATFDPHKHEAIAQVETTEYPENAIVEELQKGYLVHDRLLRPAIVRVAKSPPAPENDASDAVSGDKT